MRRIALGIATVLLLAAFPIASSSPVGAAGTDSSTSVHVINALGTTDSHTQVGAGPDANVTFTCDSGNQSAVIPVIQPTGTAADGSHTFVLNGEPKTCDIHVTATSQTPIPQSENTVPTAFDCSLSTGFSSNAYYKIVIEPIYSTLEGTIAAAFPVALTDCTVHLWQDDTHILPNGYARFTVRHAACETGTNFHITDVTANGEQVLGPIDPCQDATVELPQGVYDFVVHAQVDPNGGNGFNDAWTVFSPDDGTDTYNDQCDENYVGSPGTSMSLVGCPTINEADVIDIPLDAISLAHGQIFVVNVVDDGTGQFVPFLAGGAAADSILAAGGPFTDTPCNYRAVDLGGGFYGPAVLAGPGAAPGCAGGGLGIILGAPTIQVILDGQELPASDPSNALCTELPAFQTTVAAETDYIATLTVVDKTDTKLEGLVDDADAAIQQMLTDAALEIRPQVVIITEGLDQLNQGLRAASFNTATLGASALSEIQDGLANPPANPDVDAATATITAWYTATCLAGPPAPPATPIAAVARFTG